MIATLAIVASLDRVCADRSDLALARPAARVARIVGDPTTTPVGWHRVDLTVLDRIAHDPDIYSEIAEVWRFRGRVAIVNVESRSLEYREHASYCFREDGTLARVLSTSSGTINIDDESRYFDRTGTLLATASKIGLLFPRPGATVSPDVKPAKPTIFATVRALPFYALLATF